MQFIIQQFLLIAPFPKFYVHCALLGTEVRTQEFFGVFIDWLLAGDRISLPQTLQKWYSPKSCCKCQSQEQNTWLLFWESQLQIVFQDYIHISKINIFHDISSIKKPGIIYNFDTLWCEAIKKRMMKTSYITFIKPLQWVHTIQCYKIQYIT